MSSPTDSYRDALTGLASRELLREHLALALVRAREHDRGVALLHLGLDGFRLINEGLGRAAGDDVLREVGRRLEEITPPTNLVARSGADEFCVLLADLDHAPQHVAEIAAGQISAALEQNVSVGETPVQVSTSIGASIFPGDASEEDGLLRHADAAMREAKVAGSGSFAVYAGGTTEALAQLMLIARLRRAVQREEFVLHYQPILTLPDGEVAAVEALLRWDDPEHGLIAPLEFIGVAEYVGLIEPIGGWVLDAACAQARAWRDRGRGVPICVNVSLRQFQAPGFVDGVRRRLAEHGLGPEAIVLEITESTAMRDPSCVEPVLSELRELGLRVAIDDFGVGYSSLSRLRQMPVDLLKIDRSFLEGAPEDAQVVGMTAATLELARALGMRAVAEGVETERQREFLTQRGCALAQGFHLGHPVPAEELEERLGATPFRSGRAGGP